MAIILESNWELEKTSCGSVVNIIERNTHDTIKDFINKSTPDMMDHIISIEKSAAELRKKGYGFVYSLLVNNPLA